jgi:hypothetical protein
MVVGTAKPGAMLVCFIKELIANHLISKTDT